MGDVPIGFAMSTVLMSLFGFVTGIMNSGKLIAIYFLVLYVYMIWLLMVAPIESTGKTPNYTSVLKRRKRKKRALLGFTDGDVYNPPRPRSSGAGGGTNKEEHTNRESD